MFLASGMALNSTVEQSCCACVAIANARKAVRRTQLFLWLCLLCLFNVVNEDAMADAGRVARLRHLERDEFAVVAHDRVGRLVTGIVAEVSKPLIITAAVELQFP